MYKEVFRILGVNKTVRELNESFKKVFEFDWFDEDVLETFCDELAIIHGNGFVFEENGQTVLYEEVFE